MTLVLVIGAAKVGLMMLSPEVALLNVPVPSSGEPAPTVLLTVFAGGVIPVSGVGFGTAVIAVLWSATTSLCPSAPATFAGKPFVLPVGPGCLSAAGRARAFSSVFRRLYRRTRRGLWGTLGFVCCLFNCFFPRFFRRRGRRLAHRLRAAGAMSDL